MSKLGRWRLGPLLGRGSTGQVFRASDGRREAALKLLTQPRSTGAAEIRASWPRFDRRARALARLAHPGLVELLDWGLEPDLPQLWYAMERLEGAPAQVAAPKPIADVLRLGLPAVEALAAAHSAGVLHGDIKPHNLFEEPGRGGVLIDFAPLLDPERDPTAPGSPRWMAPECLTGGPPTASSDVYALGQTLAELRLGRAAFPIQASGPSALIELTAAKHRPPSLPDGFATDSLSEVLTACLAPSAADRPSATALSHALSVLR